VGTARLNLKKVGDTDSTTQRRAKWKNRKYVRVESLTPCSWESVGPEKHRQLAGMVAMPCPKESDRTVGNVSNAIDDYVINGETVCCAQECIRGYLQVKVRAIRVLDVEHVDVSEKRQEVHIVALFPVAFLESVVSERKDNFCHSLLVIWRELDLFRVPGCTPR
jgi:hypothetical protein